LIEKSYLAAGCNNSLPIVNGVLRISQRANDKELEFLEDNMTKQEESGPAELRSRDLRFRRPPRYPDYATGPSMLNKEAPISTK
jgi:hypothetical protein